MSLIYNAAGAAFGKHWSKWAIGLLIADTCFHMAHPRTISLRDLLLLVFSCVGGYLAMHIGVGQRRWWPAARSCSDFFWR